MKTITHLRNSDFARNVTVLATGTAMAQAIPVLASPVLTRLYTPADFGLLAVFMALVSSISPAVCGSYEVAIMLPLSRVQVRHLLGISLQFALMVAASFLLVVVCFTDSLIGFLETPALGNWIFVAPFVLFLIGVFTAMGYFANWHRHYVYLAKSKLVQALAVVAMSIGLGLAGIGFEGLLLGTLVGYLFGALYLIYLYQDEVGLQTISWGRSKAVLARRYMDYPLYSATTCLLGGITMSLPVLFVAHYYPESVVGYYALVIRVANAPLSFISTAVSQINLKKVADLANSRIPVRPYLIRVSIALCMIVLIPTVILMIFSPALFALIFGEEWREAGRYVQILMPALAVRFVAATVSTTLGATKNNRLWALWKVVAFITTIAVFGWFAPQGNIVRLLTAAMLMDVALYAFYYFLIWKAASNPRNLMV